MGYRPYSNIALRNRTFRGDDKKSTIDKLVDDISKYAIDDDVASLVTILVDKENKIHVSWSTECMEAIGLMHTGIDQVLTHLKKHN